VDLTLFEKNSIKMKCMVKRVLPAILLSTSTYAICNSDDPLACFNGGSCHDGQKDYEVLGFPSHLTDLLEDSVRGMHCNCPNEPTWPGHGGITGVHCNIPYQMCADESICFNGGECQPEQYDESKLRCLCPQDPRHDVWAGKNCEVPATSFCNEDVVSDLIGGVWFCTRGGVCKDGETNLAKKCDCPKGTFGLHCEYSKDEPCNLQCNNGGVCKMGLKDFTELAEYGLDIDAYLGGQDSYGEHCVCPKGYTGLTCEKEEAVQCGQGICFNGAECVQTTSLDGSIVYNEFCRCPTEEGESYAGKFCEHKSTTFCPAPEGHDPAEYFCANGGECPSAPHLPCRCPEGFSGSKCEVSKDAELQDDCDLECQNAGTCFFGQSPITDEQMKELHLDGLDFLLDNKHCRCPDGWIGLRCEMKYEQCGEGEHFCLHGSGCIDDNDEWTCDCRNAASLLSEAYAGEFCEHAATTFCEGEGAGKHSFCTNHGTCLGQIGDGEE